MKNIPEPVRVYRLLTESDDAGKMIDEEKPKSMKFRYIAISALALIILVTVGLVVWNNYFRLHIEPASIDKMAFPLPDKPSIAVLPFANLSGDPSQDYISDGFTNTIITMLYKNSYLENKLDGINLLGYANKSIDTFPLLTSAKEGYAKC